MAESGRPATFSMPIKTPGVCNIRILTEPHNVQIAMLTVRTDSHFVK